MADSPAPRSARVVTVFGSSRAERGSEEYEAAHRLGAAIAARGWTLCNGGHDGTMEAAAKGAKEAGGSTLGVSLALYRPTNQNPWLDQEIVAESLFARLDQLVTLGDAFVALRGGIGTLLELCLTWNLAQSPEFSRKPLVVVGPAWSSVVALLRASLPMHPWESATPVTVDSVEGAVDYLEAHFAQGGATGRPRRART